MAIDPRKSLLGLKSQGTQNDHRELFPSRFQTWPLEVTFIKGFPSRSGKPPTSTQIGLIMQEPRMLHIWYYIPLCTIFPQQSNVDAFRTKLHHSNSSPQIHHPFQKKTYKPCSLAIHGSYQQIIQGLPPPGSEGGGLIFSLQDQSRGSSKRLRIIK
ncbi:hypothetical protein O181_062805 [Austropuccinia psidii MF-1]|uniref:Uncharacterized protein n=1 Tax=Austropuccinia psidii MF-1 TaxID=1389203 RepID=A0A9Q3I1N3_9BASI|nr:hypothetical protein [Austropuccinia psidii MF-1]